MNFLTSHRLIMGTMWGLDEVLKIAHQHSIEAAPPDRGETSVTAQVKVIHDVTACIYKINCLQMVLSDKT